MTKKRKLITTVDSDSDASDSDQSASSPQQPFKRIKALPCSKTQQDVAIHDNKTGNNNTSTSSSNHPHRPVDEDLNLDYFFVPIDHVAQDLTMTTPVIVDYLSYIQNHFTSRETAARSNHHRRHPNENENETENESDDHHSDDDDDDDDDEEENIKKFLASSQNTQNSATTTTTEDTTTEENVDDGDDDMDDDSSSTRQRLISWYDKAPFTAVRWRLDYVSAEMTKSTTSQITSPPFEVLGKTWQILFYPMGNRKMSNDQCSSIYLSVANQELFALGDWTRDCQFSFHMLSWPPSPSSSSALTCHSMDQATHFFKKLSKSETLNKTRTDWGFHAFQPLTQASYTNVSQPYGQMFIELRMYHCRIVENRVPRSEMDGRIVVDLARYLNKYRSVFPDALVEESDENRQSSSGGGSGSNGGDSDSVTVMHSLSSAAVVNDDDNGENKRDEDDNVDGDENINDVGAKEKPVKSKANYGDDMSVDPLAFFNRDQWVRINCLEDDTCVYSFLPLLMATCPNLVQDLKPMVQNGESGASTDKTDASNRYEAAYTINVSLYGESMKLLIHYIMFRTVESKLFVIGDDLASSNGSGDSGGETSNSNRVSSEKKNTEDGVILIDDDDDNGGDDNVDLDVDVNNSSVVADPVVNQNREQEQDEVSKLDKLLQLYLFVELNSPEKSVNFEKLTDTIQSFIIALITPDNIVDLMLKVVAQAEKVVTCKSLPSSPPSSSSSSSSSSVSESLPPSSLVAILRRMKLWAQLCQKLFTMRSAQSTVKNFSLFNQPQYHQVLYDILDKFSGTGISTVNGSSSSSLNSNSSSSNSSNPLATSFADLFKHGEQFKSDIVLYLDEERSECIHAHKIILSASCSFFKLALSKDPDCESFDLFSIEDFMEYSESMTEEDKKNRATLLRSIIEYLYTGKYTVSTNNAFTLLSMYSYLGLTGKMEEACIKVLEAELNPRNVFILMSRFSHIQEVRERCVEFLARNWIYFTTVVGEDELCKSLTPKDWLAIVQHFQTLCKKFQ